MNKAEAKAILDQELDRFRSMPYEELTGIVGGEVYTAERTAPSGETYQVEIETFWEDQQGMYFNYMKRDGSYNTGDYPNYGRSTTMFKTREINKPWPFDPVPNPYYEGWPFPAVTGEGITVMGPNVADADHGQIFRTRPQKYEWAPDTYVAFMIRSGCDMGVSRDGVNWRPELGGKPLLGPAPPGNFGSADGKHGNNHSVHPAKLFIRGNRVRIWYFAESNQPEPGNRYAPQRIGLMEARVE